MRLLAPPLFTLALLAGTLAAQTNVYVQNPGGSDSNSGCNQNFPKQTIASAIAGRAACGGAPWLINLRAGSTFSEPGFAIPANTKLVYWDPSGSNQNVTITPSGPPTSPMITIASALGVPITTTAGIDGSVVGNSAKRIRIVCPGIGILVRASVASNSCLVRKVSIEHGSTGIWIDVVGGGTASPSIDACDIFTSATFSLPTCGGTPGAEHILMTFTNPAAGTLSTITPTISSCSLFLAPGAAICRGIFATYVCSSFDPILNLSPKISGTTIDGTNGTAQGGILHGIHMTACQDTFSPSIETTTVYLCNGNGIVLLAVGSTTGSPVLTSSTIDSCGLLATPSVSDGNGVRIHAQDGAVLTPSVASCVVSKSFNHGLVLRALGTAGSMQNSSVGGSVTRCVFTQNGGDGIVARVLGGAFVGSITTSFDANTIDTNTGNGVTLYGYGVSTPYVYPSISSPFTNNMVHHNVVDGIRLSSGAGLTQMAMAPLFTHDTVGYNGGVGVNHFPIPQPPVFPPPKAVMWNSIVRFNTVADAPVGPGTGWTEQSNIYYTNGGGLVLTTFPNANNAALANPYFVNPAAGDLHINPPVNCFSNLQRIMDYGQTVGVPAMPPLDFDSRRRVVDKVPSCGPDADRGADEVP